MGINTERDIEASLQIGPTDKGMIRLYIEAGDMEIPMDFTPDEAEEIVEEIQSAIQTAKDLASKGRR
ncbi:DUF6324 family protein [Donghicola sp.]|jgi:ArsR family metal-binding transcriptional regulator|uniref:DUF6324 family protein n=1 Tax=Donghicola sp. TaxID=1929294 RepID=UPI0025CED4DB|nr:DUF6324 family protein [Donghicola sp.]MCT4576908.1 DUF6324 family protein [Donghicola sp.]